MNSSAGVFWACVPGEVAGNNSSYQAAEPTPGSPEHRQQLGLWRGLRQLHNGGLQQAQKVAITPILPAISCANAQQPPLRRGSLVIEYSRMTV